MAPMCYRQHIFGVDVFALRSLASERLEIRFRQKMLQAGDDLAHQDSSRILLAWWSDLRYEIYRARPASFSRPGRFCILTERRLPLSSNDYSVTAYTSPLAFSPETKVFSRLAYDARIELIANDAHWRF